MGIHWARPPPFQIPEGGPCNNCGGQGSGQEGHPPKVARLAELQLQDTHRGPDATLERGPQALPRTLGAVLEPAGLKGSCRLVKRPAHPGPLLFEADIGGEAS